MLEGYSRSGEMGSNLCHNQTWNGEGHANLTEGKLKIESKVVMGTFYEKCPGNSWRRVFRDEKRGVKTYIGRLHPFPTASSCHEINL